MSKLWTQQDLLPHVCVCVCVCVLVLVLVCCAAGACVHVRYLSTHSLSPASARPSHLLNEIRVWGGGGVTTTDKVHRLLERQSSSTHEVVRDEGH